MHFLEGSGSCVSVMPKTSGERGGTLAVAQPDRGAVEPDRLQSTLVQMQLNGAQPLSCLATSVRRGYPKLCAQNSTWRSWCAQLEVL